MSATQVSFSAFAAAQAAVACTPSVNPPASAVVAHGNAAGAGECIEFMGASAIRVLPLPSRIRADFEDWDFGLSGWGIDAGSVAAGSHVSRGARIGGIRPFAFADGYSLRS